jgi:hypothetical protein
MSTRRTFHEISQEPFDGNVRETDKTLIDVKKLLKETDEERT